MKEQLVFEAKLDLSQFNAGLNQVKNTVSNVNKQITNSISTASQSTKVTKETQSSLDNIATKIRNLGSQIQGMRGMSLFDVTATVVGLKTVTAGLKKMKDIKLL